VIHEAFRGVLDRNPELVRGRRLTTPPHVDALHQTLADCYRSWREDRHQAPREPTVVLADWPDVGSRPDIDVTVERLRRAGHQFPLFGAGTPGGAPIPAEGGGLIKDRSGSIVVARLDETELKKAGRYQRMRPDDRDFQKLLDTPGPVETDAEQTDLNADTWRDEGPWLLPPVLALALLAFRRGVLALAVLCLLPLPRPAAALEWSDLWLNDNQRASRALEAEQPEKAANLFDDPAWRAAAHYRAGNYEKAAGILEGLDGADALYNRGNALARFGRTDDAMASSRQTHE
jgi:Ca-activated chloride channel family protein